VTLLPVFFHLHCRNAGLLPAIFTVAG